MSKASYHEGLTIEPDIFLQLLRIEGRLIDIEKKGKLFVYKEHPEISDKAIDKLGIKIIDSWQKLLEKRKKTRDDHVQILDKGAKHWNQWRRDNPQIRPILYEADLVKRDFSSDEPIDFSNANLIKAKLNDAHLERANFHEANLGQADLTGAHLNEAHFCRTDLYATILSGAELYRANLQGTQMAMTDLRGAKLIECKVYGMSAWDLKMEGVIQRDYKIIYTKENKNGSWEENHIEVSDLRMAQFIYLLLHNENISYVIDTITSKAVLILGRFSEEHKPVLDLIRENLNKYNYVSILFDFQNTTRQSWYEIIITLAGMARFIIADVTDARLVREELRVIAEKYPSKPIQPILLQNKDEYPDLKDLRKGYKSVLETYTYIDKEEIIQTLKEAIIDPAEAWLK
jgi:uncharacterized protein YjbI with pentapeptide repeats